MQITNTEHRKPIRSFVLRQGRITKAQILAFEKNWPKYGLEYTGQVIDINSCFENNNADLIVEIGFGNGKSLAKMAQENPSVNYLGIEVHGPGVGAMLMEIENLQLNNIKCFQHDAIDVLNNMLPDNSLSGLQLFFPDPWPKKKHHKRRIVKSEFLDLLLKKFKNNARFHMATDWQAYAEDAMEVLSAHKGLYNEFGEGKYAPRPEHRPKTKFEQRGENLGHGVWDLMFLKTSS